MCVPRHRPFCNSWCNDAQHQNLDRSTPLKIILVKAPKFASCTAPAENLRSAKRSTLSVLICGLCTTWAFCSSGLDWVRTHYTKCTGNNTCGISPASSVAGNWWTCASLTFSDPAALEPLYTGPGKWSSKESSIPEPSDKCFSIKLPAQDHLLYSDSGVSKTSELSAVSSLKPSSSGEASLNLWKVLEHSPPTTFVTCFASWTYRSEELAPACKMFGSDWLIFCVLPFSPGQKLLAFLKSCKLPLKFSMAEPYVHLSLGHRKSSCHLVSAMNQSTVYCSPWPKLNCLLFLLGFISNNSWANACCLSRSPSSYFSSNTWAMAFAASEPESCKEPLLKPIKAYKFWDFSTCSVQVFS